MYAALQSEIFRANVKIAEKMRIDVTDAVEAHNVIPAVPTYFLFRLWGARDLIGSRAVSTEILP